MRRHLSLVGKSIPTIVTKRRAYLFTPGGIVELPRFLVSFEKWLGWLLKQHIHLSSGQTLPVTVVPQMHCNAACGYCIQNTATTERIPSAWMSEKTINEVVAFIEGRRIAGGCNDVSLTLFGGEPLLNPQRCYRILERTQHLSHASIITNGVLLTSEVAQELASRRVRTIQVTFDGAQADHDSVRTLASSGGGTYKTILDNLERIDNLPIFPGRQLRVNVTRHNVSRLDQLIKDLACRIEPKKWSLSFALVSDNGIGFEGALETHTTVDSMLATLIRQAHQEGFVPFAPSDATCAFCSKPFGNGYVINADGKLYSCWDSTGHADMEVGDIKSGYDPTRTAQWVGCGYRSVNQPGPTHTALSESAWVARECYVEHMRTKDK